MVEAMTQEQTEKEEAVNQVTNREIEHDLGERPRSRLQTGKRP
jgi:hypothetical protein